MSGPPDLVVLDNSNQSFNPRGFNPTMEKSWGLKPLRRGQAVAKPWLIRNSPTGGGAFWKHPDRFRGLHVGSCCGDTLAPGGFKLAARWLKTALCWLNLGPKFSKWPPKESQAPDEAQMAPSLPCARACTHTRTITYSYTYSYTYPPGLRPLAC